MPRPRTLFVTFAIIIGIILFAKNTSSSDKSFYDNTVERLHFNQEANRQHKMGTAAVQDAKLREAADYARAEAKEAADERRKKQDDDFVTDENGQHKHAHAAGDKDRPKDAQKVLGGVDDAAKGQDGAAVNKPPEVGTSRGKWTTGSEDENEVAERPAKTEKEQKMDAVLQEILKRSPIIIFSKTYCPYSKKAKGIFAKYKITPAPFIVEIDRHELGPELQDKLEEATGRRTVPNILISGKSIGGGDDVEALHTSGELINKIKSMGGKRIIEAHLKD